MDAASVAVVVLSWNGRDDTLACLRSLEAASYPRLTVMCVDNGSVDGSADAVAAEHPDVRLVRLDRNLGFAGGMNTGIRAALASGADYVLTLNNDTTVEPGFVEPLVVALRSDGSASAACAQILFADDPPRVWYGGARWRPRRGYQGRHLRYGRPPLPRSDPPYTTDRACAAAMLVPRRVLEQVGAFDDDLFAYAEDLDWSLRARARGLHALVVPASLVRHRVSAATGGHASAASIYYALRNGIVVAERHAPLGWVGTRLRRLEALAASVVQTLLFSPSRRRALGAAWRGWRDAARKRLGPMR